ncbi:hypothetical protein H8S37_04220 [Mediterraneibacter sp. NSJ-55]|uniref:Uncharacterized protein n=1 Tax=Mediterraneibacter hominis TaxID=2763054 RepID=A0A923RP51_9FIRM|nr:hypothetical protein [Mediterraneibacter hominis]MBC5688139.1 hypothetical protein [Mediterraneibacter hominis]
MNLLDGFKDNSGNTNIEYVVAYWNKVRGIWFPRGTYEEIEKAEECYAQYRKMNPTATFAIFEHIKSETIVQICAAEE